MIQNRLDKITEDIRSRLILYLTAPTAVEMSQELEEKGNKIGIQTISNFKRNRGNMSKKNLVILDEFLTEKGY